MLLSILNTLIFLIHTVLIHWRLSMNLKTSNKSVWSNGFWYVKLCIFWKSFQYTINWDETNIKKIFFGQNKLCKKCPLFYLAISNSSQVLFLIYSSYKGWSTRFTSLKLCLGFSIFNSVSFLLKSIFLFNKLHERFISKRHNSFQS